MTPFEQLKPASFRGVPFQVDPAAGVDLAAGRRTQIHEYPKRDKPYVEDMGRGTRLVRVDAYVSGVDYIAQSQALLAALETKGPGKLVHPWLGEMQVQCEELGQVHYDGGLRLATFRLSFVESGDLSFPTVALSTQQASRTAAQSLLTRASEWYATTFRVLRTINRVAVAALGTYQRVLKFLSNPVGFALGWFGASTIQGNLNSIAALFGRPAEAGPNWASLLTVSGQAQQGAYTGGQTTFTTAPAKAAADAALIPLIRGQIAMADDAALQPSAGSPQSAADIQIAANDAAILGQTRQILLSNAVGLSAYLNGAVYDDIAAVRAEILAALDRELLRLDAIRQSVGALGERAAALEALILALNDARSAVHTDLTTRLRDSARLLTLSVPSVRPAVAIAYDHHEDAGRAPEIVARNRIRRPGFVVGDIRVLSR
jgi:prophage DNA circulation protein